MYLQTAGNPPWRHRLEPATINRMSYVRGLPAACEDVYVKLPSGKRRTIKMVTNRRLKVECLKSSADIVWMPARFLLMMTSSSSLIVQKDVSYDNLLYIAALVLSTTVYR